ncbi:MAG: sulfurtransferase-like selenium metabolism protein YedF [Deltaproteobacteria bacterium]|jgi:selenium metabolism protein YedF|nr:sulfurtransferase-like selenium metabolism protein YedF [Deltaproteobacteria bacterium]
MPFLNMLKQPCPIPVINAKKALRQASPGQIVDVLVDNEIAVQNLTKMALILGHLVQSSSIEDGNFKVQITVSKASEVKSVQGDSAGLVVAIGTQSMGQGDNLLGKNLLKAFIFSLTEIDPAPEYLLFFNGGAFMTTESSQALSDLFALAEKGTVISTCGACLDFYQLKDKLKVGAVTNMFAIVQTMAQAKRLINI